MRSFGCLVQLVGCLHLIFGCTYFEIPRDKGDDKDYLLARTMEYTASMPFDVTDWVLATHPVGGVYLIEKDDNRKVNIGHVSMDVNVPDFIKKYIPHFFEMALDGMNIHGLSISANILKLAEYGTGLPDDYPDKSKVLWYGHLPRWGLSNFKTAKEMVDALKDMHVLSYGIPSKMFGLHWAVADAEGNSYVIEYLDGTGKPTIFDNSVRVLTNDPDFRYQTLNLDMYVTMTPDEPDANSKIMKSTQFRTPYDQVPSPPSNGFNQRGLPADSTPPSRFVRMFYLREYALLNDPPCGPVCVLALGQALLNENTIVRGTESEGYILKPLIHFPIAYTQWSVLKIPRKNQMMIRSYVNMQWKNIDLNELGLDDPNTVPRRMLIEDNIFNVVDITDQLAHAKSVGADDLKQYSRRLSAQVDDSYNLHIGEGKGRPLELKCLYDCGSESPDSIVSVIRGWLMTNGMFLLILAVVACASWCLGRHQSKAKVAESSSDSRYSGVAQN
jgi:choloylglycine hydrolase